MLVCRSTALFDETFELHNILPSVYCQFKGSLMRIDYPNRYSLGINGFLKVKSMQRQGTEATRTQIQPFFRDINFHVIIVEKQLIKHDILTHFLS